MGRVRWYKRDPNAALTGMAVLSLEERGAYDTVLDLIYANDGKVEDNPRFICGWLRCDPRVWRRIRQRLLDLNKLYLLGGHLRNERADKEVTEAIHRLNCSAQAGLTSAARRNDRLNIIKSLGATAVERPSQLSTATKNKILTSFFSSELAAARAREEGDNLSVTSNPVTESAEQELAGKERSSSKPPHELTRSDLDEAIARKRAAAEQPKPSKPNGASEQRAGGSSWQSRRDAKHDALAELRASNEARRHSVAEDQAGETIDGPLVDVPPRVVGES